MQSGPSIYYAPVFHLNRGQHLIDGAALRHKVRSTAALEIGERIPIRIRHEKHVPGARYDDAGVFVGGTFAGGAMVVDFHLTWESGGDGIGGIWGIAASEVMPTLPLFAFGYWAKPSFAPDVWNRVFGFYLRAVSFYWAQPPEIIDGNESVTAPEDEECGVIATLNPIPIGAEKECSVGQVKCFAESIVAIAHNYRFCGGPIWLPTSSAPAVKRPLV